MANFINTLINGNTIPKHSSESVSSNNNIGTLAKLASEMQLIEGLQPIRITGSRHVFLQQMPVQLLEATTTKNQQFTLLNTGTPIDTNINRHAELELNTKQQMTNLILNAENNAKLLSALAKSSTLPIPAELGRSVLSPTASNTGQLTTSTAQQQNQQVLGNKSESTPPVLISHPQTNVKVIQQNVLLASAVQTLKVVGNGQPPQVENKNTQPITSNAQLPSTTQPTPENIRANNLIHTYSQPITTGKSIPTPSIKIPNNGPLPINNTQISKSSSNQAITNNQTIANNPTLPEQNKAALPAVEHNIQSASQESTSKMAPATLSSNPPLGASTTSGVNTTTTIQSTNTTNNATTMTHNTTQAIQQTFTVTDGNTNFDVQSQKALPIGSQLQVFVDQKGQFQVIPQNDLKQPSTLNSALSQSLPQQFNEQELGKAIQDLTTTLQNKNTPTNIQKAIAELLQSFPNQQDLKNATILKQSLQNSGLFLEKNLLTSMTDVSKDVKLNWLKLQSATQPTPSQNIESATIQAEQLKVSQQALERITSHQLKNLVEQTKSEFQNSPIFVEMPIRDKESTSLVQFQIEQDSSQTETLQKEKRRWLAKLRFDFPETGKFEARVRVKENQAGVIFVAEEQQTERLIRQNFPDLKNELENKEIELEQLDCFCRSLIEEKVVSPSDRLIDVRT